MASRWSNAWGSSSPSQSFANRKTDMWVFTLPSDYREEALEMSKAGKTQEEIREHFSQKEKSR